mmetsp:Transcript_148309/g.261730  ORF Transcript_148309/g.261730 Transcript_148309/m.261730 type:complete len:340 (-) Transcript_148309:11-1030(-)
MCNTLRAGLAFFSSLLLAARSLEDAVCSKDNNNGLREEIVGALSLLQNSAIVQRDGTSMKGGDRSRDGLDKDAHSVVARLNARFSNGRPSKELKEAGVLVHAFDGDEVKSAANEARWFDGSDHWSASLINARVPYMYIGNPQCDLELHAGFVFSPEWAAAHVLCSYDRDGITAFLGGCSADCVPGCVGVRENPKARRQWCSMNSAVQTPINQTAEVLPVDDHCAWPPNALDAMMEQQELQASSRKRDPTMLMEDLYQLRYNEIILDRYALQGRLPKAIEAIYFVQGPAALSPKHARKGEEDARAAQHFLLKRHGRRVPVVRFKSFSTQMPFELADETSA